MAAYTRITLAGEQSSVMVDASPEEIARLVEVGKPFEVPGFRTTRTVWINPANVTRWEAVEVDS